jgi:hypothetical protein
VPAGLGDLTGALQGFVDFLRIDPDLIAAAAQNSDSIRPAGVDPEQVAGWVAALPTADKDATLVRLLTGDALAATAAVGRRHQHIDSPAIATGPARRTVGELLDIAESRRRVSH